MIPAHFACPTSQNTQTHNIYTRSMALFTLSYASATGSNSIVIEFLSRAETDANWARN